MSTEHILSTKLTSENYHNTYYAGFYDKIILNAKPLELGKTIFKNHLHSMNVEFEEGSFRKGGMRFKILTKSQETIYVKYSYSTGQITQLIFNPSSYSTYSEFVKDSFELIGSQEVIEQLPIIRLDKTVDITLGFTEVLHSLVTKFKRSSKAHSFSSGKLTGLELGKSPEVIKVYDRSKKAKLSFPCTRLEACCTGNKTEFPNLGELRRTWEKGDLYFDRTYQNATFNHLEILDGSSKKGIEKAGELRVLCEYFPYLLVKSCLYQNGNFARDYGPIHRLIPWGAQPSVIFNTGVRKFFNADEIRGI